MSKKIGLVLSGGGVKCLAHVGLIKVLLENDIQPSVIAGTSGGAIVGALYAMGYQVEEMLDFFNDTPMFRLSLVAIKKPGFIDSNKYLDLFSKYFVQTFEELKKPLYITATELLTGKLHYFNSGELIRPLIASSAFPPYFSPINIAEGLYTDGGVLNNFPIEPLEGECDVILGSFVSSLQEITHKELNTTFKLLQRIYTVGMNASYYDKFERCQYVFMPEQVSKIGTLEVNQINKAYQLGYELAKKEIDKIIHVLNCDK